MEADIYDNTDEYSNFYQGNKSLIYHTPKNFLIWMIPIIGWIISIYKELKTKDKFLFFNKKQ
jgi:hypothetical protein